jgi:hypothetical protein
MNDATPILAAAQRAALQTTRIRTPSAARWTAAKRDRKTGMALLMVTVAVAVATVLGYAVLANTNTGARIAETATLAAQADSLAESGINYAEYNLEHPDLAPAFTGSFWPGASGVSIDASVPGTFSVVVTDLGSTAPQTESYNIASTASIPAPDGTGVNRQVTVVVLMSTGFGMPGAAGGFNGPLTLGANVNVTGDLHVQGAVSLASGDVIDGSVIATALNPGGATNPGSFIQLSASTTSCSPTTHIDYTTYSQAGVTYAATLLATDPTAGTVLGPTAANPAGIYYALNRNVNLNGVTINGSLIVKNGGVVVKGSEPNTITAAQGYPALVVDNQLAVNSTNRQLTVNGLVYAGQGVAGTGSSNTGSVLTINGSLLVPGSGGISSAFTGTVNLNYVAANTAVPTFSTQMQVPTNIRVQTWTP